MCEIFMKYNFLWTKVIKETKLIRLFIWNIIVGIEIQIKRWNSKFDVLNSDTSYIECH